MLWNTTFALMLTYLQETVEYLKTRCLDESLVASEDLCQQLQSQPNYSKLHVVHSTLKNRFVCIS